MMEIKGAVVGSEEREWESWADPEFRARSPIRWKVFIDAAHTPSRDLTMGVAELPPGATLPLHRHAPAELYYIEAGEGDVEIDGERRPVGLNDTVFIPAGALHGLTATGTAPLRFLWILRADSFADVAYDFEA